MALLAEDVVEDAVLPCCRAALLLCRSRAGDDGTQVQVAARTCRSICRSGDLAALADDEDGWDKWGVKLQGRIGRGEARLKGDVEDWTRPTGPLLCCGRDIAQAPLAHLPCP